MIQNHRTQREVEKRGTRFKVPTVPEFAISATSFTFKQLIFPLSSVDGTPYLNEVVRDIFCFVRVTHFSVFALLDVLCRQSLD